ncbi:MAG TPA: adenylate/guanylate cyclase domain-containing protein [Solirubrobacteraceae bacterium]|nr:adenylate/guanylate cyclase domain-containing protein [Solirubrobacteraceae bacterium]
MLPTTRYARSKGATIAYQVHGDGPVDLLLLTGFLSNVETLWEEPGLARAFDRIASFARLILMDRRGVGMSDRFERAATPEEDVADIDAVLDAAGSPGAVLYGTAGGAPHAIQYVAARPERARGLILYAGFARVTHAPDMPWADPTDVREARIARMIEHWGEGLNADLLAPSAADDPRFRSWFARLERTSTSPGTMQKLWAELEHLDVRPLLPGISVPALVLHRTEDALIDVRHSRDIAARIPGAKLVELPGRDHLLSVGDAEAIHGQIEEFVTGGRRVTRVDRRLLTVLFTDIAGGTARAAQVGDGRWRDLLAGHDATVRRQLARFGGREVKTTGDGFLAVFEGPPSPAVRCARAVVREAAELGVPVRAGLHTGECEIVGDDVAGMAVNIAARVCALAQGGEALASGTTYGTVVGSGLPFADAGSHVLRGVPGEWPIFRLL